MNKHGIQHGRTLLLLGFLFIGTCNTGLAFDTGNIYRVEPEKHRFHLAVVVDQETRPLTMDSTGVKNAIKTFFENNADFSATDFAATELVGGIKTSNVLFRPTLFLGDQLSLFLDGGLFNDVDAIISPPFLPADINFHSTLTWERPTVDTKAT